MKKLLNLTLAAVILAGFASPASAYDWRLHCYADSTMDGHSGFLLNSDEPGWVQETIFAFEEEGHIRLFAIRDNSTGDWDYLPEGSLIAPAAGDQIGAFWSTLPDELGRPQTSTLEAFESFTVPAGTFFGAKCVSRPIADPGTFSEVRHFTQGVGLMRDLFPGDGADVLDSYFIAGGSGYFPLAVGNWWEYLWDEDVPISAAGDLPGSMNLLYPSVPNPFNPSTSISFEMAAEAHATLRVYDTAGHLIRTLVDEQRAAGRHSVTWNGRDETGRAAPAGVYLYRFETGSSVQTRTMTLVK